MLTDTVMQALSHLLGRALTENHIRGQFRYAYASDDRRYVAILTNDAMTYVVDVNGARYCREPGAQPCGFSGHVLEVEVFRRSAPITDERGYALARYDLDMDADEIAWRGCPGPFEQSRVA